MCSALYFNTLGVIWPARLTADTPLLQTRYPIYFVVKHRRPGLPGPSPEALETCQNQPRKAGWPVSGSAPSIPTTKIMLWSYGGEPDTANENVGGADRDRTGDLMLAKHALSQLSYSPTSKDGGPG